MGAEDSIDMAAYAKPRLDESRGFEFEQGGQKAEWQVIEKDGHQVEGVYFASDNPNGELVLFIPGAPGDGVSWFEEKDVPLLLEKGYNVFSSRHGGVLPTEDNRPVFHNDERFNQGSNLGDEEMTVTGWLKESEILLEHFSGQPISIVSHSFGGLSVGHSMVEMDQKYGQSDQNPNKNIKRWVNLSGVNYDADTFLKKYKDGWQWYFDELLSKKCNIKDIAAEMASLEAAVNKSASGLGRSESIRGVSLVSVNPPEDELVGEEAGQQLKDSLGKGLVLRDKTITKTGDNFIHDFLHLEPQTLLRLLEMRKTDRSHTATLGDGHPFKSK